MANNKYPNSGLLSHARDKKSEKSPDFYGTVELNEELVRYLATQIKLEEPASMRVAIWRRSNDRGTYLSMTLSEPQEGSGQRGNQRRASGRDEGWGADNNDRRLSSRGERNDDRRGQSRNEDPFDDEIPF